MSLFVRDKHSFDFSLTRIFMKLFRTASTVVVTECQNYSGFYLWNIKLTFVLWRIEALNLDLESYCMDCIYLHSNITLLLLKINPAKILFCDYTKVGFVHDSKSGPLASEARNIYTPRLTNRSINRVDVSNDFNIDIMRCTQHWLVYPMLTTVRVNFTQSMHSVFILLPHASTSYEQLQ